MHKKTLLVFDPMRTGHYEQMIKFIKYSSFSQNLVFCENFYELDRYYSDSYDKKIVFFDIYQSSESLIHNEMFSRDFCERINFCLEKNFEIIFCRQWETNFHSKLIDMAKTKIKNLKYKIWWGNESWFYFFMYEKYKNTNLYFDHSKKIFDFLYLNKTKRNHRELLWNGLQQKNALTNSLVSCHFNKAHLRKDYELPQFLNQNYPLSGWDQDIHPPQFNDSAINIVSETLEDNNNFLTEKIWKPIIAGQIFVVHGGHGYLKKLHSMGFKTFDGQFDESYDDETDLIRRTNKIVELCCVLKEKNYFQLYENCKSILDHNIKVFFDRDNLLKIIDKELLSLLELVDGS